MPFWLSFSAGEPDPPFFGSALAIEYCRAVTVTVYLTITVTPVTAVTVGVKSDSHPDHPFTDRGSYLTVTSRKVGAVFINAIL